MIAGETNELIMSPRVGELKERQRSLRETMPLDRSASSLSMASSLNSDRSDPSDDQERLARSLSRIRIRRPSASAEFNVDLTGIANAEPTEEKKKAETDSVSTSSSSVKKPAARRQSTGGIISKVYGNTILANYPVKESAITKVYRKTILANYPVPVEEDATERTLSFSDDSSSNQSQSSN